MQPGINGSIVPNGTAVPSTKHSMLDKLKIFNKEKSDRSSKAQISKRTSSSSGFSSARSERSDSSLSLNNEQTTNGKATTGIPVQSAPSNLKKPEPPATKTKSKLLAATAKSAPNNKDTLTRKGEKKDKSPARISADVSDSKIAVPKGSKSSKSDSKLKPVANRKSFIENRSESKTSLSSQIPAPASAKSPPNQPTTPQSSVPGASTGIPKPMAAIKGTTKSTKAGEQNDIKAGDKLNDISHGKGNISSTVDNGKMQMIAPILIEKAVNQQQQQQQHQHHMQMQLQMQQALHQHHISMSDSCHSKSAAGSLINSNEPPTRMQMAPDAHAAHLQHGMQSSPNKSILMQRTKVMHEQNVNNICVGNGMMKIPSNGSIASTASSSMMAANAAAAAAASSANKFNTVPTKQLPMVNGIIYEEEKQMTVMPMRPLLRGYNSHLTLPTRGNRNQHIGHEYSDDLAQGYCSDGDALRKVPVRYSDIENGYMSEGGGGGMSAPTANGLHPKPMLLRARTQLPTTIEER